MRILMVCLGNICRSPLAQGIMEDKCRAAGLEWQIDSAGTSGWHNGEPADRRSISTAASHGLDISAQRSRLFVAEDFEKFDLVLAMDSSNYQDILKLASTKEQSSKVKLILNYMFEGENRPVPDPYYNDGFELVFDLLDSACDRIIAEHS